MNVIASIAATVLNAAASAQIATERDPDVAGGLLSALYILLPLLLAMVVGVVVVKVFFRIRPLWHYLEKPEYQRVLRHKLNDGEYMFIANVIERQKRGKPVTGKELRAARKLIIRTLQAAKAIE